jgi:hypothetical protein
MTSKTGSSGHGRDSSSSLGAKSRDLGAKLGERLAMLAADVCKRTLEQRFELLVGWLERGIR